MSQTPVLLVLLKIVTLAEYIWMDQASSAPTERMFPQGMKRLAYKVSLRTLKHLFALFKCSIQQLYSVKSQRLKDPKKQWASGSRKTAEEEI